MPCDQATPHFLLLMSHVTSRRSIAATRALPGQSLNTAHFTDVRESSSEFSWDRCPGAWWSRDIRTISKAFVRARACTFSNDQPHVLLACLAYFHFLSGGIQRRRNSLLSSTTRNLLVFERGGPFWGMKRNKITLSGRQETVAGWKLTIRELLIWWYAKNTA